MRKGKPRVMRIQATKIAMILASYFGQAAEAAGVPHEPFQRLHGALRARDGLSAYKAVASWPADAVHQPTSMFFRAQLEAIVKRLVLPGFDPESTALNRWETAEWRCRWVNRRIQAWHKRDSSSRPYLSFISKARDYVRAVLGDEPPVSTILSMARFGPGTSVGVHGDATHLYAKLCTDKWGVTEACSSYAAGALSHLPMAFELLGLSNGNYVCLDPSGFWHAFREKVTCEDQHDSVMFVPKNSKTHRAIGQPVTLNSFVQLGIGDWMSDRLRVFGIDLSDQSLNQRLAKRGSEPDPHPRGPWCTLDLEMASDSLAREVCRLLLPPSWYAFLTRVRVPTYTLRGDGCVRTYEKFSAMGNGFTFPLETLVFAAACHAVSGLRATRSVHSDGFSVYGDDIVIRQSYALELVELLTFLGFRTNREKSFLFGNFRESCGEDYVDGLNIRPAFVEGTHLDRLQLVGLHNRVMRSAFLVPAGLLPALRDLDRSIPLRPWGGPSDDAFMAPYDVYLASERKGTWSIDYSGFVPDRLIAHPVYDETERALGPFSQVGGACAGAVSLPSGGPAFAYRRQVHVAKERHTAFRDPHFVGPVRR